MNTRWTLPASVALCAAALAIPACGGDDEAQSKPTTDAGADATPDAPSCVDPGQDPLPRTEAFAAFDSKRQRVVVFGGDVGVPQQCNPAPKPIGELWAYDVTCKYFSPVSPSGGPGPRARGLAVYDPEGDRMIVFGGRYREASSGPYTVYSDVWALGLETLSWQQIQTTGGGPSGRSSTSGAYNPATKELVLFGGNASTSGASFTPLDDVWALNLATGAWREITSTGAKPEARLFHSAAIDPASGRMFVYAGGGAGAFQGPFMADLWSLDIATGAWTQESAGGSGAPMGRIHSSLAFDAKQKRLLMFAGHDDGAVGNNNDTWAFDPAQKKWTELVPAEQVKTPAADFCLFPPDFTVPNLQAPDRRSAHVAVLDEAGGRWLIYGGKTDCGNVDDVWSFDLATNTWHTELPSTVGEACVRGKNPGQCTTLCI